MRAASQWTSPTTLRRQPLHAFDADKVKVRSRFAALIPASSSKLWTTSSASLDPDDVVIAGSARGAVALAGGDGWTHHRDR